MGKTCFCTLVTSESYVIGAQALLLSLNRHSTEVDVERVVLVTGDISKISCKVLSRIAGTRLIKCDPIRGPEDRNRTVEAWQDFTKLRIWDLCEYDQVVYLDADMLVMENIDDLLHRDLGSLGFAAAPDVFPPDKFNAGCLVIRPTRERFQHLFSLISSTVAYDGGDTGFLNAVFPDWFASPASNRLPFAYNAQRTMYWMTQSQPGYWSAIGPKKILHYSSSPKPWLDHSRKGELEMLWWQTYMSLTTKVTDVA